MKKSRAITIISLLAVVAAGSVTFGIVSKMGMDRDELYITSNYRHAFAEFVTSVSDMDDALQKSLLVTSPSMAGAVCTEVFGKAQTAKMAMGILPFSATSLERTSGFIGKVGDYAYALSRKAAKGESFSQEEKDNLRAISDTASLLAMNLESMQNDLGSGLVGIDEYANTMENYDKTESEILPKTLGDTMSIVEQEFPEVPSLIYDGPFSEHLEGIKPLMLEGLNEIDSVAGRKAVAKFMGVRAEQVYLEGEMGGDIQEFCYEAKINNETMSINVSKQGGIVDQVIGSRAVEQSKMSAEEAMNAIKRFLERKGYSNMHESYYMINNNVLTASFAYDDNGVVCYPDLIKVGIALDNGTIEDFDAIGYLKTHHQREIPAAKVSAKEAKSMVPTDINILKVEKTIIPSAGKNELFCYEFECDDTSGQHYLIYVNALTGEQEKIFILLQDENGTLAA